MKITRLQLHEGALIPKWYGVAYWRWDTDVAICYPIPWNLVVRYWNLLRIWAKSGYSWVDHEEFSRMRDRAATAEAKLSMAMQLIRRQK
jgi:hypothetical protein